MTKQDYLDKFKQKKKRCFHRDRCWYKEKFQWRLEFNFRVYKPLDNSQKVINENERLRRSWLNLLKTLNTQGFGYRKRFEWYQNIYTNDTRLLDFILDNKEYLDKLVTVEAASELYLEEVSKLDPTIATDIKFVKSLSEFSLMVKVGGFNWHDDSRTTIADYIRANAEVFQLPDHLVERFHRDKNVWDGFYFYVRTVDDIMMLHLMAPQRIKKVTLLKLREKNNENLTSTSSN